MDTLKGMNYSHGKNNRHLTFNPCDRVQINVNAKSNTALVMKNRSCAEGMWNYIGTEL